jgi:hypothetical protein
MIAKHLLLGNSRFQFQKFLKSGFCDVFASQRLCRNPPGPLTTATIMCGINTITVMANGYYWLPQIRSKKQAVGKLE